MKITKYIFLFSLIWNVSFSQIQEKPATFKKIHFVYHQKPNLYIDSLGVYLDTLMLEDGLQKINFKKIKLPQDTLRVGAFIKMEDLDERGKNQILGMYIHSLSKIIGTYNVKKNRLVLIHKRVDIDNLKIRLKKFLKKSFTFYSFKEFINYNKKEKYLTNGTFSQVLDFGTSKNDITWINKDKNIGKYIINNHGYAFTNIILLDPNLNQHISPTFPFDNCDYGVLAIKSVYSTIKLISVTYD